MKEQFTVAGIGEILWDVFPNHRRLGGAPANFACHTQQLGAKAYPVSCVGADELGKEIREQLSRLGVASDYLKESGGYPTGKVDVVLRAGKPTYEIHENVAWDHIPFSGDIRELAGRLDAVCFGSLSQRSAVSKKTIHSFLRHLKADALKIFDVNLRQPFFSKEVVEESLQLATILKLSDEELPVLAGYFDLVGDVNNQLAALRERFGLDLIAYTRGGDGSILVGVDEVNETTGFKVTVVDSVGAGDSFTASLCIGLLKGWSMCKVNVFANEVAAYVCSQKGATPKLPAKLVRCEDPPKPS